MSNIKYSLMDETVDKICKSLISEPELWSFGTWDIVSPKHLGSIEIKIGFQNSFTDCRHYGAQSCKVFSQDQGEKIRKAYHNALSTIGSNKQQEILKKLNTTEKDDNIITKEKKQHKHLHTKGYRVCLVLWILLCISIIFLFFK